MNRRSMLMVVYLATFFYAIHYALTLYIESSFLGMFLSATSVGLLFTVAALVSIITLFNLPPLLRRFGNYRIIIFAVVLETISLSFLAMAPSREISIFFFALHQVLLNVLYFSLTIFLEAFSKDETTGGTRGVFLTILNAAILAGPLIAGSVLGSDSYRNAFVVSGFLILPVLFLAGAHLKKFSDPLYTSVSFTHTFGHIVRDRSLRNIFVIQFLLEFFYGIMVIYAPIYLNTVIGISMPKILGIIMPVALLPFVVFPYVTGSLADKKLGEKEMLFAGFLIMSVGTFMLSFITSREIFVWAFALFATRVGATFVETMAESYFFKHIDASGTHVISFFRNLRSFSYLISPVVASAFLALFDYRYIFVGLSIILLFGLRYSLVLKDTR